MVTPSESNKDLLKKVEFKEGAMLFREGDPAEALFVIDSGSVTVSKLVFQVPAQMEILGVGDVLGESALFEEATYGCSAVAREPTRCLRVAGRQFGEMVKRGPDIALRILRKLSARIAHHQFRLSNFALRTPVARLMHQLLAEMRRTGGDGPTPIPFDLPDVLALERGAVDENMRRLMRQGILSLTEDGQFVVADREGFNRYLVYLELKERFEHPE